MSAFNALTRGVGATRRQLLAGCLVVLLFMLLPATALAASTDPNPTGPDECAECHTTQAAAWQGSPHAQALTIIDEALQTACGDSLGDCECLSCHTTHFDPDQGSYAHAGVTCEACHGSYVLDHPQDGVMQLQVDAATCQGCHTTTYQQWHETAHAGANVQCTGCHLPHSQETRLVGEELCASCHREQAEHLVHHNADVHCTDCHLPPSSVSNTTAVDQKIGGAMAPDHSFELAVESCANCHGQSIHQKVFNETVGEVDQGQLSIMTERARELANELEDAKRTNTSLKTMSVVGLGFGMGVGGVLGIIFAFAVSFVYQERAKK